MDVTATLRRSVVALPVLAMIAALGGAPALAEDPPLLEAPVSPVPPLFDRAKIDTALAALDGIVAHAMAETGVPGVAVAVVTSKEVLYAKGFGVREVGKPEPIDTDTVFLLASVSKPIASAVVAGVVGRGLIAWDDPVSRYNPAFALSDPFVTKNATFADLMSHRSGLRTGSGDLLEDLGFDRAYILGHLVAQPLDPFRSTYHYSNFGYTMGGEAAAVAAGTDWERLAEEVLFGPLGMKTASYRHADYLARPNHARIHVRLPDGTWAAKYDRDPDAEAPAGGASASIADLIPFVRMQLGGGSLDGRPVIDPAALAATHVPHVIPGTPADPAVRTGFYGLGWNVTYDDQGRTRIGHSGAFNLGTATNISFLPGEDLGVIVLTNGQPIGVAEAIGAGFFDVAQNGRQTVDWVGYVGGIFAAMDAADAPKVDYGKAPPAPKPPADAAAYAGTYDNAYYGPLTVTLTDGRLAMAMGPEFAKTVFPLTPYDGDTFSFETIGENGNGLAGAIFTLGDDGRAAKVVLDFYDVNGLGTFVRE